MERYWSATYVGEPTGLVVSSWVFSSANLRHFHCSSSGRWEKKWKEVRVDIVGLLWCGIRVDSARRCKE